MTFAVVEIDCTACKDRHVLGVEPGTRDVTAWCTRSARRYSITLDQEEATAKRMTNRTESREQMQELLDAADQVDQDAPDFRQFFIRWRTRYSDRNIALLWLQRPTATELHTYRGWLQNGRQVRKGEKSIRLLAPHVVTDGDGDERLVRVRPISLFDVEQTDAQ